VVKNIRFLTPEGIEHKDIYQKKLIEPYKYDANVRVVELFFKGFSGGKKRW
jgi:hypothetical protein